MKRSLKALGLTAVLLAARANGQDIDASSSFGYTFDTLDESWAEVYGETSAPLFHTFFIDNIKGKTMISGAAPKTGWGAAKGSGSKVAFFPVVNFNADSTAKLLDSLPRVAMLKGQYSRYIGATHDVFRQTPTVEDISLRSQTIDARLQAMKLDEFTMTMALFLNTQSMPQKCKFHQKAKSLGNELKLNENQISVALPASFVSYGKDLLAYYQDKENGFAGIPPEVCSLNTLNSLADTEKQMKDQVEVTIRAKMKANLSVFNKALDERLTTLGDQMTGSEVTIPIRGLFELERGFRDSKSLYDFVKADSLRLYTHSAEEPSAIESIKADFKNISSTENTLSDAEAAVAAFNQDATDKLLGNIAKVAALSGLPSSPEFAKCRTLGSLPKFDEGESRQKAFQENFDTCLSAIADLYSVLIKKDIDSPFTKKLSDHLVQLIQFQYPN